MANGCWAQKRISALQPESIHDTQAAAVTVARNALKAEGGGELIVKGKDGTIRAKDTIAPGRDPSNIRG